MQWLRRENETSKAYQAFCYYLELGPQRSLDGAYRKAKGLEDTNKRVTGRWVEWYDLYKWRDRAEAYDQHLAMLQFQNAEEKTKQKAAAAIAKREEIRRQELDMAEKLIARAMEMLNYPIVEKTIEKDGKTIIFKPVSWDSSDIPRFVEVGDKLLRLSNDMETARVALEVDKAIDTGIDLIIQALEGVLDDENFAKAVGALSQLDSKKKNKGLN